MYARCDVTARLGQGELLSDVIQYIYDPRSGEINGEIHDFSVVSSQECDLLRAHEALSSNKPTPLNGILLFPASPVDIGRKAAQLNSTIWGYTRHNSNERYHVLQGSVPEYDACGEGIPDLLIDFRNFFTLSFEQIVFQIEQAQARRRYHLLPPYRDHFQARAASYLARIPLDPPHQLGLTEGESSPAEGGAAR